MLHLVNGGYAGPDMDVLQVAGFVPDDALELDEFLSRRCLDGPCVLVVIQSWFVDDVENRIIEEIEWGDQEHVPQSFAITRTNPWVVDDTTIEVAMFGCPTTDAASWLAECWRHQCFGHEKPQPFAQELYVTYGLATRVVGAADSHLYEHERHRGTEVHP